MRVFHSLAEIPASFGPSVLTIGNFDGLHLGHQRIMRRVTEIARAEGLTAVVLTFDPHPAQILAPDRVKRRIMTTAMRLDRMAAMGIDAVLLLPFTVEFGQMSPEDFAGRVIEGTLHAARVLVGEDFRFGNRQSGDIETLRKLGLAMGFAVEPMGAVLYRGCRVSSTAVRDHLESGAVSRACRLLGRPFTLAGRVVAGHGIGRTQTVPTLNLSTENEVQPRDGVYVTRTREVGGAGRLWNSITNVGTRPTFSGRAGQSEARTIETFLLGPLVGNTPVGIEVEFLRRVREERTFDSPDALKSQILKDVGVANRLHKRLDFIDVG